MNNLGMYTTKEIQKMSNDDKLKAYLHNTNVYNKIKEQKQLEEYASNIRHMIINSEGKENRNRMRRKYQNILFLDDKELIQMYEDGQITFSK